MTVSFQGKVPHFSFNYKELSEFLKFRRKNSSSQKKLKIRSS